MISLEQRQHTVLVINQAIEANCGVAKACIEAGIDRRTFRRWTAAGSAQVIADARPEAIRPVPSNRFSDEERARILASCHEPRFADVPPSQIVPVLAYEGVYQGSESTYYRVLHEADEQHERGRARPRTSKSLSTHCATGPNQLWSWDVTFLGSPTRGIYYYLYMIMDIWSRKIVGYADPVTGEIRRFMVGPKECEITGLCWSEDGESMFVGIQHPGDHNSGSNFPDGDGKQPRYRDCGRARARRTIGA